MLVGPTKQLKQIIYIEHSIVKNPNWPEATQLAIYKHGRGSELEKQIQEVARPLDCESDTLTTRPRCLPRIVVVQQVSYPTFGRTDCLLLICLTLGEKSSYSCDRNITNLKRFILCLSKLKNNIFHKHDNTKQSQRW